jgi:hypothetical protein
MGGQKETRERGIVLSFAQWLWLDEQKRKGKREARPRVRMYKTVWQDRAGVEWNCTRQPLRPATVFRF